MDPALAFRLAVALILGLIIGAERSWQSQEEDLEARGVAGVRTFAFAGLLGALTILLARETTALLLPVAVLGLFVLTAAVYVLTSRQSKDYGLTTELALILTFTLGAVTMQGYEVEAVAAAVVVTALLGWKEELHSTVARLERREVTATIQLLLLAAVALPLLPNRGMGPWNALNPREVGYLVLLIAGVSYVGYFAVRLVGARAGFLATGVLGGLTSSTAVTVTFSRMAAKKRGSPALLAAGVGLAAATMSPRLVLELAVVNRSLLPPLLVPLGVLALVPLVAAIVMARRFRKEGDSPSEEVALRNPLDLKGALVYGAVLAALFVLVAAIRDWAGREGVFVLAAVSGLVDVDAMSLSLARSAREGILPRTAQWGILLNVWVNTLAKAALAAWIGRRSMLLWCSPMLVAAAALSAVSAGLLWTMGLL